MSRIGRWWNRRADGHATGSDLARDAPLLSLENVSASVVRRARLTSILNGISLEVGAGDFVAVYGQPMSGRSTLLRVAGGIEPPAAGTVRFEGHDLASDHNGEHSTGIGYLLRTFGTVSSSQPAIAHVAVALMPRRLSKRERLARAHDVLDRVGAPADAAIDDLSAEELTLVALARALVSEPRLLLVDEPMQGVEALRRARITSLLTSIASEGIGVLIACSELSGAAGAHRPLLLSDGQLDGRRFGQSARVIPFERSSQEDAG